MSKHFEFHFSESQPEEDMIFDDVEYPHIKVINNAVTFSTDTKWDNIILEFAKFLDNVGYVGVHERVQGWVDSYWEPLYKLAEEDDEDTSAPGLSD
jgi:hypothetical protein